MLTKSLSRVLKVAGVTAMVPLATLVLAPKAHASTLLSTTPEVIFSDFTDLDGTDKLTFNKYDSEKEETIIDKIVLSLKAELTTEGTVTNKTRSSRSVTVKSELKQFDIQTDIGLDPFAVFSTPQFLINKSYSVGANKTIDIDTFTTSTTITKEFTSIAEISKFLGKTGTYSFLPFTNIETNVSANGGNVSSDISTLAKITAQVQYYGEKKVSVRRRVPEASTTFGILALAGVMLVSQTSKPQKKLAV